MWDQDSAGSFGAIEYVGGGYADARDVTKSNVYRIFVRKRFQGELYTM